ncbi:NAD-dependent epimerase/dehydratase family protein [Sphingobium sp. HBC34]|uniref:NAD-dependent epimerase/dehydratase family protein n=1 Tax=Sphingobium cyanobacteriorum TaxID=3063954 RepID=A0ABT8ZNQ1_9SPHN|nr:NAD-dependent epimerase/dehydratase family protein [Sphingobium sp. HBC34]MDO7836143.1 NAD-dependent epimerase/dehydratase family protein [Sphingobium sp. HBC34]
MPHIMVTGANGFIGRALAARLVTDARFADHRITLTDLRMDAPDIAADGRVHMVAGNLADPAHLARLCQDRVDILFHLAGVLGGAAETEPVLSRRINLDATLDLFDRLRSPDTPPRIVLASSIAVFGPPLPAYIDDDSMPSPTMVYGAHKRMAEIAMEQQSARGWIDGIAIRLPGIVARKDADSRLKSAFLNTLFHDFAAGRPVSLPVSEHGTSWLISVPACIDALLHAATLPPSRLGRRRALTLPAQCVCMGDLVAGLRRRFPASPTRITYQPDPAIEAQFAAHPPLSTPLGDALGFVHDGSIDRLIERALLDSPPLARTTAAAAI